MKSLFIKRQKLNNFNFKINFFTLVDSNSNENKFKYFYFLI